MRNELSRLITESAQANERFLVLSGDHGYALFDEVRKARPSQFINVGVMEQAMVGIAAGLAKTGFRPVVYGLAAFVPVRVLEQIKLDVCFQGLPVVFLGDGAGLVYSTLGVSHQCAEDLACLRPLPGIRIYSPCDAGELTACYHEAVSGNGPSYIRIGKSDRPALNLEARPDTEPYWLRSGSSGSCLVAAGSMVSMARELAEKLGIAAMSIPRIKPFPTQTLSWLERFEKVVVLEEHSRYGGLHSSIAEFFAERTRHPAIIPVTLQEKFSQLCGSYQYALSEHGIADHQLLEKVSAILNQPKL